MTGFRLRSAIGTLTALCMLLAGCGFQLRGTQQVPVALQPLALDCGNAPAELCQALREQLTLSRVKVTDTSEAAYRLKLGGYERQRRASAITTTAAAAEYTLRHSVQVQVITSDRIPLIEPANLSATETYRYDEANVLAKRREEAELEEQLNQQLAQQILFRLVPLTQARIDAMRQQYLDESPEAGP